MHGIQHRILKIATALEKMGYHITEVYDTAGYLQLYVDGQPMKLRKMIQLLIRTKGAGTPEKSMSKQTYYSISRNGQDYTFGGCGNGETSSAYN